MMVSEGAGDGRTGRSLLMVAGQDPMCQGRQFSGRFTEFGHGQGGLVSEFHGPLPGGRTTDIG